MSTRRTDIINASITICAGLLMYLAGSRLQGIAVDYWFAFVFPLSIVTLAMVNLVIGWVKPGWRRIWAMTYPSFFRYAAGTFLAALAMCLMASGDIAQSMLFALAMAAFFCIVWVDNVDNSDAA